MSNFKTFLISVLITSNLFLFSCHKKEFNSSRERKEVRENYPDSFNNKPTDYFRKHIRPIPRSEPLLVTHQNGNEHSLKNDGDFIERDRAHEDFSKISRKSHHHRAGKKILNILGFIFIILLGIAGLYGAVRLINGFLKNKHIKAYNEWKQYKLKKDEANSIRNNIYSQNFNSNRVNQQINNPNENNSGYSYISLGRSLRNDFNNAY